MELEALLAARPSRREDLGAWYSQLRYAADRAGTPVLELADRLRCSRETIYSWRRRLTKERSAASRPQADPVRVEVTEPSPVPDANRIEVRTRTGHTVLIPTGFDPSALATVLRALERC